MRLNERPPTLGATTPVLRMFDEAKAREFYVGFLGFAIDFAHRFGEEFPLYLGLSRGACRLQLSEHHGDATPGAHVRIEVNDVAALAHELAGRRYKYAKPGTPEATPWGTRELTIGDPFGNRLTFYSKP
jgi:catechol 2,3-dioxygenase-like lactoylglutathione lyase family enzyme